MRIQEQTPRIVSGLVVLLLSLTACHATRTPPRHGCFDPVPLQPTAVLNKWQYQLRWPSAHAGRLGASSDEALRKTLSAARRGLPLVDLNVRPDEMGSDWSPLNRALSAVRGFPTALVLDLSNESSTALTQVISLAAARNQKHQIILKCHSSETTEFIQRQYPGVAVTVVGRSPLEIESALALSPEPEFIEIGLSDATESIVRKIHNFGSAVSVRLLDTAEDNPLRWTQLMDMGADIVLTDFPEKFVRSIPKACGAH